MSVIVLPDRSLDETSPIPLYYQLRELIADAIKDGQYGPDHQLPSERELASRFCLSRMTVRQATVALVNDGLLVRRRGKGTYVAQPKIEQGLLRLTSFSEDMRQRGLPPSTRIITLRRLPAAGKAADLMGLELGSPLILLERLRLAADKPMAYELCYLPFNRFPDLSEASLGSGSLYELLEAKYNVKPTFAWQSLEATLASQREAQLLQIKREAPLLQLERVTWDEKQTVIEFVKSLYRADRYKFSLQLHIKPPGGKGED